MTHAEVAEPQQTAPALAPDDPRVALFANTVRTTFPELVTYAQRLVGPNDAPDAVQDAMASTYKALGSFEFRGEESMRGWLFRSVRNASLNLADRRQTRWRHHVSLPPTEIIDYIPGFQDTSFSRLASMALSPRTQAALAQLTDDHRELVTAVCIEEIPLTEYAKSANIPYGTALSRSNRAKKALRNLLASTLQTRGE